MVRVAVVGAAVVAESIVSLPCSFSSLLYGQTFLKPAVSRYETYKRKFVLLQALLGKPFSSALWGKNFMLYITISSSYYIFSLLADFEC